MLIEVGYNKWDSLNLL